MSDRRVQYVSLTEVVPPEAMAKLRGARVDALCRQVVLNNNRIVDYRRAARVANGDACPECHRDYGADGPPPYKSQRLNLKCDTCGVCKRCGERMLDPRSCQCESPTRRGQ